MASQVDIPKIVESLAAQIRSAHSGRQINVYTYDEVNAASKGPSVSILPGDTLYVPFGTMGPSGRADVGLVLRVRANSASRESNFMRLYGFASHGTGQADSLHDAVMADRSLGGQVNDCTLGSVGFGEDEGGPYLDFEVFIIALKQGANV